MVLNICFYSKGVINIVYNKLTIYSKKSKKRFNKKKSQKFIDQFELVFVGAADQGPLC